MSNICCHTANTRATTYWHVNKCTKKISCTVLKSKELQSAKKKWPVSFKWCEIWICESYNNEQLSFSIVMLRKQLNTPDSTATIKKFHWWWRIHVNKWIDCDWCCDDQVNKWGPITMTSFAEAEEQAQYCAKKWSGTIQKWQDLGLSNASLKGGFRREHKLWQSAMRKAPKPSAISTYCAWWGTWPP